MRHLYILYFFLCIGNFSFCQFNFEPKGDIEFIISSKSLSLPFFGGLNYTQISDMDIDFDGDLDLVLFDRSSNNIRALENVFDGQERTYKQFFNSNRLFPKDITYRLQLFDFNNDGKKDLFTYGVGGIKAYKNIGNNVIGLQWEIAKDLIYTKFQQNYSNLYVSLSDIPALVDVDHDNDMDVLTFNINGVHLEYHQNQSQELYGHSDSLIFEIQNECWGKFSEDPNNNTIVLNDQNAPCNGGGGVINPKGGMHSGSTVLALDLNNDQVMDLILGDLSSKKLTKLINGGTSPNTNSPMISVEYDYPQNTQSLNLDIFPAAFYLDVDFDGIKDLVVGANAKNVSENVNSLWFYKNTGSNSSPNFAFQQKNFIQSEMLDVGTGSLPVFFDQNNDGKDDLLIANFFKYIPDAPNKQSSISVFRNTTTVGNSSFTFLTEDFLNLKSENLGLRILPSFADINADGKKDMLLSLENGTFRLYLNNSGAGNATFVTPSGSLRDADNNEINESTYPYGQLFDLNKDGLIDIIVGRRNGLLTYYENIGTSTTPQFLKKNSKLGNIDVSGSFPDGYAMPHFIRIKDTTHLFLGSSFGKLQYYTKIDGKLEEDSSFHLHSHDFLNIDVQGYSSFFVNDIDNDDFLDLWVGEDLGGLLHFEVDPNSSSSLKENEEQKLFIYPNPTKGSFVLQGLSEHNTTIKINSILGQEIKFESQQTSTGLEINLDKANPGIYIVGIKNLETGQSSNAKITIQ